MKCLKNCLASDFWLSVGLWQLTSLKELRHLSVRIFRLILSYVCLDNALPGFIQLQVDSAFSDLCELLLPDPRGKFPLAVAFFHPSGAGVIGSSVTQWSSSSKRTIGSLRVPSSGCNRVIIRHLAFSLFPHVIISFWVANAIAWAIRPSIQRPCRLRDARYSPGEAGIFPSSIAAFVIGSKAQVSHRSVCSLSQLIPFAFMLLAMVAIFSSMCSFDLPARAASTAAIAL